MNHGAHFWIMEPMMKTTRNNRFTIPRASAVAKQTIAMVAMLLIALPDSSHAGETDPISFDDRPKERYLEHPPWFKASFLDLREDLVEATQAGKRGVILYIGQENCPYCEALIQVNFGATDIADYTQRHFDVIELDLWGSRELTDFDGDRYSEHDFANLHGTNFTPSLMFYDQEAKLALRLRGYYPPYKFRAALEYVADAHYKKESFRDYLARADPPPKFEIDDLNEQDFFLRPPHMLDRSRIAAQRPLMVFFEQRDCHACDVLHTQPLSDPQVRAQLRQFDVIQVDMWSKDPIFTPDGRKLPVVEWSKELGLFFAPTLVFFDEGGREVLRIASVVHVYRLGRILEYVANRGYRTGLTYQQWHGKREIL
jgi:thioredoxin-related protein